MKKANMTLTISRKNLARVILALVASGLTFEARELDDGTDRLLIEFTGGY